MRLRGRRREKEVQGGLWYSAIRRIFFEVSSFDHVLVG
jgi:hypothetical protein